MQELRIENDNIGFDKPARVNNVSDMFTSAFKHVPRIIKSNYNLIVIMTISAVLAAAGMEYLINYFLGEKIVAFISDTSKSVGGAYSELFSLFLKGSKKFIFAYMYFIIMMPIVYLALYYVFYSYIKKSEAFSGLKIRNFIQYIIMFGVNSYVLAMFIAIVISIPLMVIVGILVFFSLLSGLTPFIMPLLQLVFQLASMVLQYLLMPFISQVMILSVFRKLYPIRCIKLSFLIPFKACGSKRGGIFGGNYWRIVLINFVSAFGFMMGLGLVSIILIIIGALMPDKSVFGYLSTGLIFAINMLVLILFAIYSFSFQTIYTIENLYFGNYPYLEEIKNASAE